MFNLNNLGPIMQLAGHAQKILGAIDEVFKATQEMEDTLNAETYEDRDELLPARAQIVVDRVADLYALMRGAQK